MEVWNGIWKIIYVEASHANAYARAIAFFSYIWFKYNVLSLRCCKLGGLVVSTLSSGSSAPGFDSQMGCANVIQCYIAFYCFKVCCITLDIVINNCVKFWKPFVFHFLSSWRIHCFFFWRIVLTR